jgi:hypothetical protein
MEKRIHLLLSCWIISHVGHAVLSIFYEKGGAVFFVPIIRLLLVLLVIGTWKRHRWSAKMCAISSVAVVLIQGRFIWVRDAYGALSIPVLVFDILEIAVALLYLAFFFSSQRERYLPNQMPPNNHALQRCGRRPFHRSGFTVPIQPAAELGSLAPFV